MKNFLSSKSYDSLIYASLIFGFILCGTGLLIIDNFPVMLIGCIISAVGGLMWGVRDVADQIDEAKKREQKR
jgi:hypothetical protein